MEVEDLSGEKYQRQKTHEYEKVHMSMFVL